MMKGPELLAKLRASAPPRPDVDAWWPKPAIPIIVMGWVLVGLPITAVIGLALGSVGTQLGPAWGVAHIACVTLASAGGAYLASRLLAGWSRRSRSRMVALLRDGVLYDGTIDKAGSTYAPGAGLIREASAHFTADGLDYAIRFGVVSKLEERDAAVTVLYDTGNSQGIAFDANGALSWGQVKRR